MDYIFIYDKNYKRAKNLSLNPFYDPQRKTEISIINDPLNLYLSIKERSNALLYYISEKISDTDRIRLNMLRANIRTLRIAIISDEKNALLAWELNVFAFKKIPASIRDIKAVYYEYVHTRGGYRDYVPLKNDEGNFKLPLKNINFFEADGSYTLIHRNDGGSKVLLSKKLKEFEKYLDHDPYLDRIHKTYIINLAKVRSISSEEIKFYGKTSQSISPVSRELGRRVRKALFKQ